MNPNNYIITVGRQLGTMGDDIAKHLAKRLGFQHINKAILMKSAELLNTSKSQINALEAKGTTIWDSFLQTHVYDLAYIPDGWYIPTGRQLFETQSKVILQAANESSCVVVGRCSNFLFQPHPRHIGIFLHAGLENRVGKMEGVYGLTGEETRKTIMKNDKDRAKYYNTFTGKKWLDLSGYDIVLNTDINNDAQIEALILEYICAKFPELKAKITSN